MDYYSILETGRASSPEEIKAAYRKLAMKYHPDRGGDEKKFKEINEAYNILGDPQKKASYDQRSRPHYQGHGETPFEGFDPFGTGTGNPFNDMFRHFGFQFRSGDTKPKNKDLHIKCRISLKDSYLGKTMNISYPLPSGNTETLEFTIPSGIDSGQSLRINGYGDDSISDIARGDLNITVEIEKNREFWREDLNLCTNLEIDIFEAMVGCTKTIKNIDDSELEVTIRAGAQHGIKYNCKGFGFKSTKFNNRGDLIVIIFIKTPIIKDPILIDMVNQLANKVKRNNP